MNAPTTTEPQTQAAPNLLTRVEQINTLLSAVYKAGLLLGGVITLIYCARIGHYPANVSLGDGLFFIAALLGFGFAYTIFVMALYACALALNFVRTGVNPLLRWIYNQRKNAGRQVREPMPQIPKLSSEEHVYAAIGWLILALLILLSFTNPIAGVTSLMMSLTLVLVRGFYKNNPDEFMPQARTRTHAMWGFVATLALLPLLLTAVMPNVLSNAMTSIGVRKTDAAVQVDAPRGAWIAHRIGRTLTADQAKEPQEFEHVVVAFRGFGDEAVIEIEGHRFVVPNNEARIDYPVGGAKAKAPPATPPTAAPAPPAAPTPSP